MTVEPTPKVTSMVQAARRFENVSFDGLLRGLQDFVLRTASTSFLCPPALARYMPVHNLDLLVPKDHSVRHLLKEDMGRGYIVFARSLKGKNLSYYLASLMALALAGAVAVVILVSGVNRADESKNVSVETFRVPSVFSPSLQFLISSASEANRHSSHRRIYPYSIIPGGISSVKELKAVIAHDSLVKAHYRGFNLAKAHIVRLKRDRAAYVSYRSASGVYWTKKKVILFAGETLITDGENASRTRCGNRISDRPTPPVSQDDPPDLELDEPVAPLAFPSPTPPLAPTPGGPFPIFPLVPVFPGGGSSPPPVYKPPVPVQLSEPDTLCLLIAALPAAWLIRKKRYR